MLGPTGWSEGAPRLGMVGPGDHHTPPPSAKKNYQGLQETSFLPNLEALTPKWQISGRNLSSAVALGCGGEANNSTPTSSPPQPRPTRLEAAVVSDSQSSSGAEGSTQRHLYLHKKENGVHAGEYISLFLFHFHAIYLLQFSHSGHSYSCTNQASKDAVSRVVGGRSERPQRNPATHCIRAPSGSSP